MSSLPRSVERNLLPSRLLLVLFVDCLPLLLIMLVSTAPSSSLRSEPSTTRATLTPALICMWNDDFSDSYSNHGTVGDMAELGIYESLQLKRSVLLSASEAAEMILRVDNIIQSAPRERAPENGRH